MLIAIDLGNTNIVIGVYENHHWKYEWRLETNVNQSIEDYRQALQIQLAMSGLEVIAIQQVIISSVVPPLTSTIHSLAAEIFHQQPILVGPKSYKDLQLSIESPNEVGTDLVANAVAAMHRFPNRNCVVVDFGTALTFTTVSKDRQLLGVTIAPGIKTAIKALFLNAAQLPEVPLDVPKSAIGTNTNHAIQAGILLGFEGLVIYLLKRHKEELDGDCAVIATGGLSGILENLQSEYDQVDTKLTLDGLRLIGNAMAA